jgi:uncharacterized protein
MFELLVQVTDLPAVGRKFSFMEQRIWTDPIAEFGLPYRFGSPMKAELEVHPHGQGCLISGVIRGSLCMPCARCAEETEHVVNVEFQEFEVFPGTTKSSEEDGGWIVSKNGLLFLDAAGFLWEQFQLALPVKTLCSPMCRGVCVTCGANRNWAACACTTQSGDPRWNALRSLHIF